MSGLLLCASFLYPALSFAHPSAGEVLKGDSLIVTQHDKLPEFIVAQKRKTFKETGRGVTAQVAGTALALKHEVRDVLSQMPGLLMEKGMIKLLNGETPVYYINHKKVNDYNQVQALNVADIKSITVQTVPDIKYGADVHAVVLIKLLDKETGMNAYMKSNYTQSFYASHREEASFSFTRKRWAVQGMYAIGQHKQMATHHSVKEYTTNQSWHYSLQDIQRTKRKEQQFNVGIDWNITRQYSIGLFVDGMLNDQRPHTNLHTVLQSQDATVSSIQGKTDLAAKRNNRQYIYTLYQQWHTDRGLSVDFDLHFVDNHEELRQNIRELSDATLIEKSYDMPTRTKLWNGEYSVTYPCNSKMKFYAGGDFSHFRSKGESVAQGGETLIDNYHYTERKWAFFANCTLTFPHWSLEAGLRYENSQLGWINRQAVRIADNDKGFFPQIRLSYQRGDFASDFFLRRQIQRPPLAYLNGQKQYLNQYEYQIGNLSLRPQDAYRAEWKGKYKRWSLSLSYSYIHRYISGVFKFEKDNANQLYYTWENVGNAQLVEGRLSYTFALFPWWEVNASAHLQKPFLTRRYDSRKITYNRPTGYVSLYQQFPLRKWGVFSLTNRLRTTGNQRLYRISGYHSMDAGYSISLWKNRIGIDITATDLFHNLRYKTSSMQDRLSYHLQEYYHDWSYTISVAFRFQKNKVRFYERKQTEDMHRLY